MAGNEVWYVEWLRQDKRKTKRLGAGLIQNACGLRWNGIRDDIVIILSSCINVLIIYRARNYPSFVCVCV